MRVHMNGKALLFKTIAVQGDENYSDFQAAPNSTTPVQAAELLKQEAREVPQTQAQNQSVVSIVIAGVYAIGQMARLRHAAGLHGEVLYIVKASRRTNLASF